MIHNEQISSRDGKSPTLSNAIFAFDCLRELRYCREPELQEFREKLEGIRKLRNEESHSGYIISEQKLDEFIQKCIDMYIYVVASSIKGLKNAGYSI